MSKQDKGSGGRAGDDILDELTSVRSLLGDALLDVDSDLPGDEEVPMLTPDGGKATTSRSAADGDAHNQIPLLGSDGGAAAQRPDLRKALAERENPFLPRKQIDELHRERQETTRALEALNNNPASPSAAPASTPRAEPAAPSPAAPGDAAMEALIDSIVARWLPKLEQELRDRLKGLLKP